MTLSIEQSLTYLGYVQSGWSAAGDGTSLEHVNYETNSAFYKAPNYRMIPPNATPEEIAAWTEQTSRLLGVEATIDHSAETQHQSFLDQLTEMSELYSGLPSQRGLPPVSVDEIMKKYVGQLSDHAPDQKKLFRIRKEYKAALWRKTLGAHEFENLDSDELQGVLEDELHFMIDLATANKIELSEASADTQADYQTQARAQTMSKLVERGMRKLSLADRVVMETCLWSGCAAHKAMNLFKHAIQAMHESAWKDSSMRPPIVFFNKDNLGAVAHLIDELDPLSRDLDEEDPGYGEAQRRAVLASVGGGQKLTSIFGAVVRHKDKKKGQQKTAVTYLELTNGKKIYLPDTSNTRYGSHGDMASVILIYYDSVVSFMEHIKDAKESGKWTNIELNIVLGLKDPATLCELAAMSIFSETVFHPLLRHARFGDANYRRNGLDDGPWYNGLIQWLSEIIEKPEIVLSHKSDYTEAAFDKLNWHSADAIKAARDLHLKHPAEVRECVIQMFKGALEATSLFMLEFTVDGEIENSPEHIRQLAYRFATNDISEGELGSFRTSSTHGEHQTTLGHNAKHMYARNDTSAWYDYVTSTMTEHERKSFDGYIAQKARDMSAGGKAKKAQEKIVLDAMEKANAQKRAREARKKAEEEEIARVKTIVKERDPLWPRSPRVTVPMLKEQLRAYRLHFKEPKLGLLGDSKEKLMKVVKNAISRLNRKERGEEAGMATQSSDPPAASPDAGLSSS